VTDLGAYSTWWHEADPDGSGIVPVLELDEVASHGTARLCAHARFGRVWIVDDSLLEIECDAARRELLAHVSTRRSAGAAGARPRRRRWRRSWRTFRLRKVSPPYILKYTLDAISGMALHHDLETLTLVVYLNDRFEGGGTHLPKWNYVVSGRRPGEAILYPGGLSHEHEGLPIRSGSRYLLGGAFY
jgi:hypothetical protein